MSKRLSTIYEHDDEEFLHSHQLHDLNGDKLFLSMTWHKFDHSQSLSLGRWHSTWMVHVKGTAEPFVLQSCDDNNKTWTEARKRLLELGRRSKSFVTPRFKFTNWSRVFVCSEIADTGICVADLIGGTAHLDEEQTASVIKQVIVALLETQSRKIAYTCLRPSNVFVSREGKVRLAAFGPKLAARELIPNHPNPDCQAVGILTNQIFMGTQTGQPLSPQKSRPNMNDGISEIIQVEINRSSHSQSPSDHFLDFLSTCKDETSVTLESLRMHKFLQLSRPSVLVPLVIKAELTALKSCVKISDFGDKWQQQEEALRKEEAVLVDTCAVDRMMIVGD